MMKQCTLFLVMILLCATNGLSQSRRNRSRSASNQSVTIRVPDELLQQMIRDDKAVEECVNTAGINEVADNLSVKRVDLNRDGNPEFIVESTGSPGDIMQCFLCGPRRCNLWVYRKTNGGYELLLQVWSIDGVTPMRIYTNGYRDLKLAFVTGNSRFTKIFKLDGRHYQQSQ